MKKRALIFILLFILMVFFVYAHERNKNNKAEITPADIDIILSPHFDDGVLSLGGLMSKREHALIVATFFTQRPARVVHTEWDKISGFKDSDEAMFTRKTENETALAPFNAQIKNYDYPDFQYRKNDSSLRESIAKDIVSLLEANASKEIFIYGPATFGPSITHPDHQLVHDAFMDVMKANKNPAIHFAIYEDYPYAHHFELSSLADLHTYLEKTEKIKLEEKPVALSKGNLLEKISSVRKYTSQVRAFNSLGGDISYIETFYKDRCEKLLPQAYACEVVDTFN